jgi:hypothetical protein
MKTMTRSELVESDLNKIIGAAESLKANITFLRGSNADYTAVELHNLHRRMAKILGMIPTWR